MGILRQNVSCLHYLLICYSITKYLLPNFYEPSKLNPQTVPKVILTSLFVILHISKPLKKNTCQSSLHKAIEVPFSTCTSRTFLLWTTFSPLNWTTNTELSKMKYFPHMIHLQLRIWSKLQSWYSIGTKFYLQPLTFSYPIASRLWFPFHKIRRLIRVRGYHMLSFCTPFLLHFLFSYIQV